MRSGLAVFNQHGFIYYLFRFKPYYMTKIKTKTNTKNDDEKYVEKYCLPRGKGKSKESALECSFREFIEECGFFFDKISIFKKSFILSWRDPSTKLWQYEIFFAIVNDNDKFSINLKQFQFDFNDNFKIKLENCFNDELLNYYYFADVKQNIIMTKHAIDLIQRRRLLHIRENVVPKQKKFSDYEKLVKSTLNLYASHNYDSFFQFIINNFSNIHHHCHHQQQ